jgi:hypothetical protein
MRWWKSFTVMRLRSAVRELSVGFKKAGDGGKD